MELVIELLSVIGLFVVAFSFMALSLHFSQYKKRSSGCCGGKSIEGNHHNHDEGFSCHSCPDKEHKDFSSKIVEVEKLNYIPGSEK